MMDRWERLAALGARLRAARDAKGWTQAELALRIGVAALSPRTNSNLSSIENGSIMPSAARLRSLCAALDLDYHELARLAGYEPEGGVW